MDKYWLESSAWAAFFKSIVRLSTSWRSLVRLMLFGNVALNKISVSKILLSANTVIHEMARYQQINQPCRFIGWPLVRARIYNSLWTRLSEFVSSGLFHFVVKRAIGLHENKEHYLQEAGKRGLAHSETDNDWGFIRSWALQQKKHPVSSLSLTRGNLPPLCTTPLSPTNSIPQCIAGA